MQKYVVIIILCLHGSCFGQTERKIDSLRAVLNSLNTAKSAIETKIILTQRALSEQEALAIMELGGSGQGKAECVIDKCYLMKKPAYDADIVTFVPRGTIINISIDRKYDGYVKAEYGGYVGYVY